MSDLERFINDTELYAVDPLIKMALIHNQFESIHPFYDGNGRTGRILNVLFLVRKGCWIFLCCISAAILFAPKPIITICCKLCVSKTAGRIGCCSCWKPLSKPPYRPLSPFRQSRPRYWITSIASVPSTSFIHV